MIQASRDEGTGPGPITEAPPRGGRGGITCEEVGSDRIFETSKSGEFSGSELLGVLFL